MLRLLSRLSVRAALRTCTAVSPAQGCSGAARAYSSRGIKHLQERGLISEVFPDDSKRLQDVLNSSEQCFYSGFDPTADSLHVGNLLVLVALLHCQRAGHEVIAVIGGATGQIGDPSGRRTERDPMEIETVEKNTEAIEENLRRVFSNHERHFWTDRGETDPLPPLRVMNNMEWYAQYSLVDFLAIIGRRFRMSNMLSRTSVQSRLQTSDGMSFTEFTYQVFQAYDWLYLWRRHGCAFQVGGADQRGNMVSGYELITGTTEEEVDVFGLTVPLITSEEGDKLGKSAGNTVWLDPERTSAYDLYQYFVRRADGEVERLLRLFTFYPSAEVDSIMAKHNEKPESRHAQKKLAESVTLLVHGEDGLRSAKRVTNAIYSRDPEALVSLADAELRAMFKHSPVAELTMESGMTTLDLAMAAKCFRTEADAARIMSAGGFHINQRKVTSSEEVVTADSHVLPSGLTLLRVGGSVQLRCVYCEYTCLKQEHLDVHVKQRHGHIGRDGRFKCEWCEYSTNHSEHMAEDRVTHTGERRHYCAECGKTFTEVYDLTEHRRLHSDQPRPYACNVCGKAFTQTGSLQAHRRIHTGEKVRQL